MVECAKRLRTFRVTPGFSDCFSQTHSRCFTAFCHPKMLCYIWQRLKRCVILSNNISHRHQHLLKKLSAVCIFSASTSKACHCQNASLPALLFCIRLYSIQIFHHLTTPCRTTCFSLKTLLNNFKCSVRGKILMVGEKTSGMWLLYFIKVSFAK